jgi:uncharacterized membrane protein
MQIEEEINPGGNGSSAPPPAPAEPVWTFRGYQMRPGEFNTAMVHLYRGEIQRANTWRNRLDTTTNWAIITVGAAISFSLSDPTHHHGILLINIALVLIFLSIEARRYRYYELVSYRVRLLETDFFAAMLVPPFHPSPDWAETLAASLLRPKFPISNWEALGRRFRRNYFALIGALLLIWLFKNYTQDSLHTNVASSFPEFVARAAIGPIAGEWVFGAVVAMTVALVLLGLLTLNLQEATGEVLEHHRVLHRLRFGRTLRTAKATAAPSDKGAWQRPTARREEFMTMIISEKGSAVAERVMQDLNRGVTALHGEGMYTQKPREVLMCALTETEIEALKRAVNAVDPQGFVVVMPAAEIAGRGFTPLEAK